MSGPLLAAGDTTGNKGPEVELPFSGRKKTINKIQKLVVMAHQLEACAVSNNSRKGQVREEARDLECSGQGRPTKSLE